MKRKRIPLKKGRHEYPLPGQISPEQKKENNSAHREAEKDIRQDPELNVSRKNDDLDEAGSARLGENTDLA